MAEIKNKLESEPYEFNEKRKWDIFNFHVKHNSFYKQFLNQKPIGKWEDIPVMNKPDMQQSLDARLTDGFSKNNIFTNKTSGSSGHPFTFAKDKFAHALTWAHIIQLYKTFGIDLGKSPEARFYGIPKDAKGYHKERLKDMMSNRYRFDIFDLSDQNLSKFVKIFKLKAFEFINGYTSSIVMFAKYLIRQKLVLKDICPSLKICITTSEMLYHNDRKIVEKAFGVLVVNEYGASEAGVIAFENKSAEWLVNHETLFVEITDENGKYLPPGEEGQVLITSLYNKAHPLIRYAIGDLGVIAEHNKNKAPTLKALKGRTNVFAILPGGKKIPALSFYYVTKTVIDEQASVKEFKIVQETAEVFCIKYVADNELSLPQKKSIKKAIDKYLQPNLIVKYERKTQLDRTERGKLRQFESKLLQNKG